MGRVLPIPGLASWYGGSERLRSLVNLVIVGGVIDPAQTMDREASRSTGCAQMLSYLLTATPSVVPACDACLSVCREVAMPCALPAVHAGG